MVVIILVLIYLLSVGFSLLFFKIAFSKNGRWRHLEMKRMDWFLTFIPVINTMFSLVGWIGFNPKKQIT